MITLDELNGKLIGRCGLKSQAEVELLWEAVIKGKWGWHLEIGTLWGGSAVVAGLAKKSIGMGHVVTVDPMSGGWWVTGDPAVGKAPSSRYVLENLARFGVAEWVSVVVGRFPNVELERQRYATALVDGDHSYEGVVRDWWGVRDFARLVLFHDYDEAHPGVVGAVGEEVREEVGWMEWRREGSLVGFLRG